MKFSKDIYDFLKRAALIWLPAFGTLYFTIAGIWGLRNPEQVIGTITAIDTFLGVVLAISSKSYIPPEQVTDGNLVVDKSDPSKDVWSFEPITPLDQLTAKGTYILKVVEAQKADK